MFLRVVLTTFIVYQAVNANQSGLEDYHDNPAIDYFWTTVRQTEQHFIDAWNLNDPANVVSRETLQEIWYPLERSLKDKTGAESWMRISNHFKETLTHPQAADTLETLFSCIHRLLIRNASKEVRNLYKGLDKKDTAWQNLYELKTLLLDRIFKIQEDDAMRKSFNIIKSFLIGQIRRNLKSESPKPEEHSEKSSHHEKHGKHQSKHQKQVGKSHSRKTRD